MNVSKIKKLDEKQRKNKGMTAISSLVRIWKICHSYPGYSFVWNLRVAYFTVKHSYLCNNAFYYRDNGVLRETRTFVFSIFSIVKIWKSYVRNAPVVRARPNAIFPLVSCWLFLHKYIRYTAFRFNNDLVKFSKENKNIFL